MVAHNQAEAVSAEKRAQVEIHTLGGFTVKCGDEVLSEKARRAKKLWKLFTYLLRNRGQRVPSGTIISRLWPDGESADPQSALHNLMYRLRQLFDDASLDGSPVHIESSGGNYCFRLNEECWLDADEFLNLSHRASSISDSQPAEAMDAYREALSLYRGHYLDGWFYDRWVISARRQYRRRYADNVVGLLELLRRFGNYPEIIEVCKDALSIEPFLEVEDLHYFYMEALAGQHRSTEALNHYDFLTQRLHQEYGKHPSRSLQNLRKMIADGEMSVPGARMSRDIAAVRDQLVGLGEIEGAFLCDRSVFRELFRVQVRLSERIEDEVILGLLTVEGKNGQLPSIKNLGRVMTELENILVTNLRKGDVVSQWTEAQYLVLLTGAGEKTPRVCRERICREFDKVIIDDTVSLSCQFEVVHPEDSVWTRG